MTLDHVARSTVRTGTVSAAEMPVVSMTISCTARTTSSNARADFGVDRRLGARWPVSMSTFATGARTPSGSWCKPATFNLVPLPEDLSDDAAAALGCRFATSYRAVVGSRPGSSRGSGSSSTAPVAWA